MAEHLTRNEKVVGSIPTTSSTSEQAVRLLRFLQINLMHNIKLPADNKMRFIVCGRCFYMLSVWKNDSKLPEFEKLRGDLKTDVLIIGGGMAGILCAYMLQQAGVNPPFTLRFLLLAPYARL